MPSSQAPRFEPLSSLYYWQRSKPVTTLVNIVFLPRPGLTRMLRGCGELTRMTSRILCLSQSWVFSTSSPTRPTAPLCSASGDSWPGLAWYFSALQFTDWGDFTDCSLEPGSFTPSSTCWSCLSQPGPSFSSQTSSPTSSWRTTSLLPPCKLSRNLYLKHLNISDV